MIASQQPHPVGISHFADGQVPGATGPLTSPGQEQGYLQPEVQVQDVAQGAKIEEGQQKSLCQRIDEQKALPGVREWFDRNKGIIGWIGVGYLALRVLRGGGRR
jgi:hypothetical protein